MPGPGRYYIKVDPVVEVIRLWIYNFDVGHSDLKGEHKQILEKISNLVRSGGNIKLLGLASTTGDDISNERLSSARCDAVEDFLRAKAGPFFDISKIVSAGETMARAFKDANLKGGTDDNVESDLWRGVVVNAWNRDVPPPPPVTFDSPLDAGSWASNLGQTLDEVGFAIGIVDLAADLANLELVAAVTGPAGLLLSCVQSILAMPLLFASTDALANTNGRIQGAADAIQDMCDQFSSPALSTTPYSKWPAIRVPDPHISENPQPTQSQLAWRHGQTEGLKTAIEAILKMEQHPQDFTTPDGKHMKMSGRLWLRLASRTYRDNCGVKFVIEPMNEKLKQDGRHPYPTF